MPVAFLRDEQAARYGQCHADPSPEQRTRFFYLSAADKQFLVARRLPNTRLNCAVQLGTLRFLGTFLVDPPRLPPVVVQTLASQLGLAPEQVAPYRDRLNTGYEHQPLIQAYLQYQSFDGRPFGLPAGSTPRWPPAPCGRAYSSTWPRPTWWPSAWCCPA